MSQLLLNKRSDFQVFLPSFDEYFEQIFFLFIIQLLALSDFSNIIFLSEGSPFLYQPSKVWFE